MLNTNFIPFWNEIQHDLSEENGHIFGIELDLCNTHQYFYHKMITDGVETIEYLADMTDDIYKAINAFNETIRQT